MNSQGNYSNALNAWAPGLADKLTNSGYLGSKAATRWLAGAPKSNEWAPLLDVEGYKIVPSQWLILRRSNGKLPAPLLLLMLEHCRVNPHGVFKTPMGARLRPSVTLANMSFRAAAALYEDAKQSFIGHEVDVAVSRFRNSLAEFRFAIESGLLTDKTRKTATGMYAATVAMIARWVGVSADVAGRALRYSEESMLLGNGGTETLMYRLELIVLNFDQGGGASYLHQALELVRDNASYSFGTELVQAEVMYRLALLPECSEERAESLLRDAKRLIVRKKTVSGSLDEARCSVLATMLDDALSPAMRYVHPPQQSAIPRGILTLMATKPTPEIWRAAGRIVKSLELLRRQGSIPAAALSARFLRQMVDGPPKLLLRKDLSLYVEVTKWLYKSPAYDRHVRWEAGSAALCAAKITGRKELADRADEIFSSLKVSDPDWPLTLIGVARVREYISEIMGGDGVAPGPWRDAAALTLRSPNYARANLGGRNEVFAIVDVRGFLSNTFVFKRTTKEKADHEAGALRLLRRNIIERGEENIFEVPRSLAIVEVSSADERKWVHVTQRSSGRLLSDLLPEEAIDHLPSIVDLLAIFHNSAGDAPEDKSAWRPLKAHLKMWARSLFDGSQADVFVDLLRNSFPHGMRLVRKRDGHASNWLIDSADRIVAIDFESVDFTPAGYDVAQLVEDNAIIGADSAGWMCRMELMGRYLEKIQCDLDSSQVARSYAWFALARALRLGTEAAAGKSLRRHAREICVMVSSLGFPDLAIIAKDLQQALSRVDQVESNKSAPTHNHRQLSKAMALMLRHKALENGLDIDGDGFVDLDDLASVLNVDSGEILAVAEHPAEPRYEVVDGRIRALYGHSLDVHVEIGGKIGEPDFLYHGTSWAALDCVVEEGLKPMERRFVHLTNNGREAVEVGERKGAPVLLSIEKIGDEEPVVEGIWIADAIGPERLSIINSFDMDGI